MKIETGLKVKTSAELEDTRGMMVAQKHLDCRTPGITGTVEGLVGGHGGNIWWVKHDDGAVAAYCYTELEPITPEPTASELKDLCKHCGGLKRARNPTGKCDHLYWPDNLTDEAKRANGYGQEKEDQIFADADHALVTMFVLGALSLSVNLDGVIQNVKPCRVKGHLYTNELCFETISGKKYRIRITPEEIDQKPIYTGTTADDD
jgi:hypothetical protein